MQPGAGAEADAPSSMLALLGKLATCGQMTKFLQQCRYVCVLGAVQVCVCVYWGQCRYVCVLGAVQISGMCVYWGQYRYACVYWGQYRYVCVYWGRPREAWQAGMLVLGVYMCGG